MSAPIAAAPARPDRASRRLRQVEEQLRAIIRDDQTEPQIGFSCELLEYVVRQVGRLASMQEIWEVYADKPLL